MEKSLASDTVPQSRRRLFPDDSNFWAVAFMAIHLDRCVYSISGFSLVFLEGNCYYTIWFWLIDAVELKKIVRTFLLWIQNYFFKNFDVGGAHNVPLEGPVMYVTCHLFILSLIAN